MDDTMTNRIYLGLTPSLREIFRCTYEPTFASHGDTYNYTVGPFRTVRGARFMRDYGFANPHCRCVAEAERLGRAYAKENQPCS